MLKLELSKDFLFITKIKYSKCMYVDIRRRLFMKKERNILVYYMIER